MQTHHPETRKPAFRWLGLNGKPDNRTADSLTLSDSKKRIFGTDLTNATTKRLKMDENAFPALKPHNQVRVKQEKENEDERVTVAKSYQFGPFAPANAPQVGDSHDEKGKQAVDWESLASSYRPQYHNQGTFPRPIVLSISYYNLSWSQKSINDIKPRNVSSKWYLSAYFEAH